MLALKGGLMLHYMDSKVIRIHAYAKCVWVCVYIICIYVCIRAGPVRLISIPERSCETGASYLFIFLIIINPRADLGLTEPHLVTL